MKRIIAHLDMDAFFASVEERHTLRFRGLPLVVGAEPGKDGASRGVVSTASYKAREYGIHSAMSISEAWKISQKMKSQGKPEVIFLPVDFELYNKSSANIFNIIKKYSDNVEQASIDEFYFDLSFANTFKKARKICEEIKKEILEKEKITCSVGIAPNRLISKIAAGQKKPDGLFVVEENNVQNFLDPLPIRKIPGIGPKTADLLYAMDVQTIEDLRKISKEELIKRFHKWGADLYHKARGEDDSPIVSEREVKSIGEQSTFAQNTLEALYICEVFQKMCKNVFERFLQSGFDRFKTIAITVRFFDFETKTYAKSPKKSIGLDDYKRFELESLKLILPFLDKRKNPKLKKIRLVGVRVEKLEKVAQKDLGI